MTDGFLCYMIPYQKRDQNRTPDLFDLVFSVVFVGLLVTVFVCVRIELIWPYSDNRSLINPFVDMKDIVYASLTTHTPYTPYTPYTQGLANWRSEHLD